MVRGSDRFPAALVGLAVVAAIAAAYLPAFSAGFVWDDDLHLINNPALKSHGLYRVWVLGEGFVYWPVTWSSYWAEHRLWGLAPGGYHAVNIALHALNVLLVWRLLLLLRVGGSAALLAALIFGLHPQNVESVAWISQRKNLLSMAFYLLSLHAYLRFDARADAPRQAGGATRWLWYAAAAGAFVLGMLSKGSIAPLPFVLLLLLAWRRDWGAPPAAGDERAPPRTLPWRRRIGWRDLAAIAPFLLLAVLLTLKEVSGQAGVVGPDAQHRSGLEAVLRAGWVAWFYAGKTLLPWELSFVYPSWRIDPGRWLAWIPLLAAVGVWAGALAVWLRGGRWAGAGRVLTFVVTYYGLMIAPALGFADFYYLRYSPVADHYQYYAQIGIAVLVGAALMRWAGGGSRRARIAGGALLLGLAALTYHQCIAYEDEESLWRDTLRKNPDASLALNNLARLVSRRGDRVEALSLTLRATEADPTNREAWLNAGTLLEQDGQSERALEAYRKALAHWPGGAALSAAPLDEISLADAHRLLGVLVLRLNRVPTAAYHLRRAVALDPENAAARTRLADVDLLRGAVRDALALYAEASALAPGLPEPLEQMALVYASYPDRAIRDAARALELAERATALTRRRSARALEALAAAYAESGRFEEAAETAVEAAARAEEAAAPALAEQMRARSIEYRERRPYRMTGVRLR